MKTGRSYSYKVVDVFTRQPLEGNALAVFPHSAGLDDATMQGIARELNLSETVFVVPKSRDDCDAAIRIFTPAKEMPFAGHPTVGASFVLLEEGLVAKDRSSFVLEEKIGPVPIRVEQNEGLLIWLTTPPITDGPVYDRALCAEVLGLEIDSLLDYGPQVVSAGNPGLFIPLKTRADVDRAQLDSAGSKRLQTADFSSLFAFVFAPVPGGAYSRMFAPEHGIVEDPATGSATGPLASYMLKHGLLPPGAGGRFISEQGTKMGRRSLLHIEILGENGRKGIAVGGYVTPLTEAVMSL